MMFELLRIVGRIPMNEGAVEALLQLATDLVMNNALTVDDWSYLASLINFRIEKQRKGEVK